MIFRSAQKTFLAHIDILRQHSLKVLLYAQDLCLFYLASPASQKKVDMGKKERKTLGSHPA